VVEPGAGEEALKEAGSASRSSGNFRARSSGHVIVTSRINEWRQVLNTDGIEVQEFAHAETVKFLRERVPRLAPADNPAAETAATADADRLAEVLGDLALAAEHAASYLARTGRPASTSLPSNATPAPCSAGRVPRSGRVTRTPYTSGA
jgi:hypothetical protein